MPANYILLVRYRNRNLGAKTIPRLIPPVARLQGGGSKGCCREQAVAEGKVTVDAKKIPPFTALPGGR